MLVNRIEQSLRQINPRLSLHYWDWTQDPRAIPNANLGGGRRGTLNLFTPDFMGYGGTSLREIGEPWLSARYYVPGASPHRDQSNNPRSPNTVVAAERLAASRASVEPSSEPATTRTLEPVACPRRVHSFVNMAGAPRSRSFVFRLHSNVDRLYSRVRSIPPRTEDPNPRYARRTATRLQRNIIHWSASHHASPVAPP